MIESILKGMDKNKKSKCNFFANVRLTLSNKKMSIRALVISGGRIKGAFAVVLTSIYRKSKTFRRIEIVI